MSVEILNREYLLRNGFTENRFSFEKGNFSLMKTTLGIFYEVVYKGEIIKKISARVDDFKEIYLECTGEDFKETNNQ